MNGLNGFFSLSKGLSRRSSSPTGSTARRRSSRRELHAEWLERRLALAAVPTASLSAPDGFINTEIPLTVTFDNTGTDIGYGPFIDVIMPASGNAPPLPNNGVSFKPSSATYLGAAVPTTVLTFGPSGQVNHPFAKTPAGTPVVITGDPGDQLVVFQLPFGSYGPAQPPAAVSFTGIISSGAQPASVYNVTATGGFAVVAAGAGHVTIGIGSGPGATDGGAACGTGIRMTVDPPLGCVTWTSWAWIASACSAWARTRSRFVATERSKENHTKATSGTAIAARPPMSLRTSPPRESRRPSQAKSRLASAAITA